MKVHIKLLNDTATIPTLGSSEAAGCDLYANLAAEGGSVTIAPGTTYLVKTGIAMEIPTQCATIISPR